MKASSICRNKKTAAGRPVYLIKLFRCSLVLLGQTTSVSDGFSSPVFSKELNDKMKT